MSGLAAGLLIAGGATMFGAVASWCGWVSVTLIKILQGISHTEEKVDDLERRVHGVDNRLDIHDRRLINLERRH